MIEKLESINVQKIVFFDATIGLFAVSAATTAKALFHMPAQVRADEFTIIDGLEGISFASALCAAIVVLHKMFTKSNSNHINLLKKHIDKQEKRISDLEEINKELLNTINKVK